jgi:hypothetical protein
MSIRKEIFTAILAKEDAFIMFPYPDALIGDEWFYMARKVDGLDPPDLSVKQAL